MSVCQFQVCLLSPGKNGFHSRHALLRRTPRKVDAIVHTPPPDGRACKAARLL
jgi:hypothetical protein